MTISDHDVVFSSAQVLRDDFDASFAAPLRELAEMVELLAITVGPTRYAVHLDEISAAVADKPITPIPSPSAALLGLAGFRGAIVSVYDMATLLGESGSERPRWMVLCAADPSVALAFDQFDGHLRLDRAAMSTSPDAASGEVLHVDDSIVPVVRLAALLAAIGAGNHIVNKSGTRNEER